MNHVPCVFVSASVSEESFMLYHTKIHDMLKGRLASSRLSEVTPHLCQQFKERIQAVFGSEGNIAYCRGADFL